jgi:predicted RNA-binding protein YlxR (DUF448 family)
MGKKRVGERTCIGCGAKAHKAELLRFVRTDEGRLCFDLTQKEPGRGGYLCPREACFTLTAKKRRLSIRYRREVKEDPASLMHAVRIRIENDMLKGNRFSTMPPENQDVNVKNRPVPISGPGMIAMHFYSEFFSGGSSEWPK